VHENKIHFATNVSRQALFTFFKRFLMLVFLEINQVDFPFLYKKKKAHIKMQASGKSYRDAIFY